MGVGSIYGRRDVHSYPSKKTVSQSDPCSGCRDISSSKALRGRVVLGHSYSFCPLFTKELRSALRASLVIMWSVSDVRSCWFVCHCRSHKVKIWRIVLCHHRITRSENRMMWSFFFYYRVFQKSVTILIARHSCNYWRNRLYLRHLVHSICRYYLTKIQVKRCSGFLTRGETGNCLFWYRRKL